MTRAPSSPRPLALALVGLVVSATGAGLQAGLPADAQTSVSELFGTAGDAGTRPPPGLDNPVAAVAPAAATPGALAVHTVASGDTLWKIAARYCGDGNLWRHLFEANRESIRNPNLIYPGQRFRIACTAGGAYSTADGQAWSKTTEGTEVLERAGATRGSDTSVITLMPLPRGSFQVTSHFGPRNCRGCSRNHQGIDLAAEAGTPVGAAGAGRVIRAEFSASFGNVVEIQHADGSITRYAHMKNRSLMVRAGDTVAAGQQIGQVGSTGHSTGPHLHFELRTPQRVAVNPAPALGLA